MIAIRRGRVPLSQAEFDRSRYPRTGYAWYVVAVLLVAYILAFVDRDVISLLVQPIRADLGISDLQMSFLLGGAFALFYTFFGMPIAWLADRWNRSLIIFFGVTLWSIATVLCGMAGSYWALFAARVAVGVGEAALNPPALSLLKDYFPPDRLGRAVGVYTAGISAGMGVGSFLAATLYPAIDAHGPYTLAVFGTVSPWQFMFILVGLPGFLVALMILTIREPARRVYATTFERVSLWQSIAYVGKRRSTYGLLFVGLSAMAITNYGVGYWIPEFLRRTFDLDVPTMAWFLQVRGVLLIVSGVIGVLFGGWLSDTLNRRYDDGYIRAALIGYALLFIGYVGIPLMPTPELSVMMLVPATLGGAISTVAGVASVLAVAPPNMRAQLTAMYYFTLNLIGLMLGPTMVALLTDRVFRSDDSLYLSLAIVAGVSVAGGTWLLWRARGHFGASMREARSWQ
jgi:MFS family permease